MAIISHILQENHLKGIYFMLKITILSTLLAIGLLTQACSKEKSDNSTQSSSASSANTTLTSMFLPDLMVNNM